MVGRSLDQESLDTQGLTVMNIRRNKLRAREISERKQVGDVLDRLYPNAEN
jgi:hypothetical protein